MRPLRLVALALAVCASSLARPAAAYERQWHVGGELGYAMAGFPSGAASGFVGGAHLGYGLNDSFNLRVDLDISGFGVTDALAEGEALPPEGLSSHLATLWHGGVGVEYVVDILEWVPYAGLTLGFADVLQRGVHDPNLAFEIPFGLAYLPIPELSLGVEGRYRLLMLGSDETPTQGLLVMARLEHVWGF